MCGQQVNTVGEDGDAPNQSSVQLFSSRPSAAAVAGRQKQKKREIEKHNHTVRHDGRTVLYLLSLFFSSLPPSSSSSFPVGYIAQSDLVVVVVAVVVVVVVVV